MLCGIFLCVLSVCVCVCVLCVCVMCVCVLGEIVLCVLLNPLFLGSSKMTTHLRHEINEEFYFSREKCISDMLKKVSFLRHIIKLDLFSSKKNGHFFPQEKSQFFILAKKRWFFTYFFLEILYSGSKSWFLTYFFLKILYSGKKVGFSPTFLHFCVKSIRETNFFRQNKELTFFLGGKSTHFFFWKKKDPT